MRVTLTIALSGLLATSPAYATTSRVLITRPAPLPMMPTSPSSLT